MPDDTTKTLARRTFHSPSELAEVLADLLDFVARFHDTQADLINLDTDLSTARLVENTLTDGSRVYNIELE